MAGHAALTLVLPEDAPDPAGAPEWRARLARAEPLGAPAAPGYARAAALCALFGVATAADADVPVGALGAAGELGATRGWWLRADPVPLVAARAELRLLAASAPDLGAAQAAALVHALERAEVIPGARWHAPVPARWYLELPGPVTLRTAPPAPWVGRDVEEALPQGADAGRYRASLNAAQMVMHALSEETEAGGAPAPSASSVWFWGAGEMPVVRPGRFRAVCAHDPLARGLAHLAGASVHGSAGLPSAAALEGELLQVAAGAQDVPAARAALERGEIAALTLIHAPSAGPAVSYRVRARRRWWKPWTR